MDDAHFHDPLRFLIINTLWKCPYLSTQHNMMGYDIKQLTHIVIKVCWKNRVDVVQALDVDARAEGLHGRDCPKNETLSA
ncbi:hypothetical protein KBA01_22850 [Kozakia baliensis]|nr:hypothetical protein KBA01_22850 [Kozakia baliensis]